MPVSIRNIARTVIAAAASRLDAGETCALTCPFCNGGRTAEVSLYVTRQPDGAAPYICHRASCGERGVVSLSPQAAIAARKTSRGPWEGSLSRELSPYWRERFDRAVVGDDKREPHYYGLHALENDPDTAAWVLRDIYGQRLGISLRSDSQGKRIRSHKETDKSLYHYLPGTGGTWVVEDALSAAAVCAHGRRAVALLGTVLHDDVREDITAHEPMGFIVALDPGAEKQAAQIGNRLRSYTTRPVHVLYNTKDIKDMTLDEQVALIFTRGAV